MTKKTPILLLLAILGMTGLIVTAYGQVEVKQTVTTNYNGHKTSMKTNCTSEGCNGDFTLDNPNQTRYSAGYLEGIADYNLHVNDTSHHFECPVAKLAPHGDYCQGYDRAIKFMFSDQ